ncbi:MAG: DUF1573 domain-containing protein [Bacteroidota bacterium]
MMFRAPLFSSLLLGLVPIVLLFSACQADAPANSEFQSARVDGEISNADIIRNPVGEDGSVDTVNVAKMSFPEANYYFGAVDQGAVIEHSFSFVNTGKVPLIITDARATCGCTVPSYPERPIAPGESGVIDVRFDTANKEGQQNKPITLLANTYPNTTEIRLIGNVDLP